MTSNKSFSPVFLFALLAISGMSLVYVLTSSSSNLVATISPSTQVAQVGDVTSGLVGWWKMDDGSGTTTADSIGGNTGTILGSTPQWITGIVGGGLAFDGTDNFVQMGNIDGSSYTSGFSYSFWVRTSSPNSAGGKTVFSWGSTACILNQNGNGLFNCYVDGSSGGSATTKNIVNDGSWHNIVFVNTSSGQTIYLDGVQSGTTSETLSSLVGSPRIGRSQGGSTGYWNGSIDDVRIYSIPLSAMEVSNIYSAGSGQTVSSPGTVTLTISNGGNGTITSNPSGISCGSMCSYSFNSGKSVTLTANTSSNYTFSGWSGGNCSGIGTCSVTMNADTTVSVSFSQQQSQLASLSISDVQSSVTSSSATVTWTTNDPVSSQVIYGSTSAYGSNTTNDTNLVTSHSQTISGLQAGTMYHFQVSSTDSSVTNVKSTDQTFVTTGSVNTNNLVVPHLVVADPPAYWYGGPSTKYGYDILNMALTRDVNTVDNVKVEWSSDGVNWTANTNSFAPNITISVGAVPYNTIEYYRIRAISGPGYGGSCGSCSTIHYSNYSNILKVVTLYPVSNLKATAKTHTSVSLSWRFRGFHDQSGNEYELLPGSGYKIERSTDSSFSVGNTTTIVVPQPYTTVPDPDSPTNQLVTYTDSNAFNTSTTYYYRVRAFTAVGEGEPSKVVSTSPNALPLPVDYSAVYTTAHSDNNKSSTGVAISFSVLSTSEGQTGYRIDKSMDGTNWTTLQTFVGATTPGVSNSPQDTGLTPGHSYYYKVVATNDVGDSPYIVHKVDIPNISSTNPTLWYVDNSISNGNNDGTSWNNAWRDLSGINWYAIKPGDTIYISGGTNGQTYDETLFVKKGGTSGSPVTITFGQDSGHNGKVLIKQGVILQSSWVTINGAKSAGFSFSSLENIVNNDNIEITNQNDQSCVFSGVPEGTKILWTDIHDCGTWSGPNTLGGNVGGVIFNGFSGVGITGAEIAYSHIHDVLGIGAGMSGTTVTDYGMASIHHNIIERTHNDFVTSGGGVDYYNNIGRNWISPGIGHPDGMQIWAPYVRIYNNVLYDTPGQLIYIQLAQQDSNHVEIYNNIMYAVNRVANQSIIFTTANSNFMSSMFLEDVLVANNITYGMNNGQFQFSGQQSSVGTLTIKKALIENNIFYPPSPGASSGSYVMLDRNDIASGMFSHTPDDIVFNDNIIANTNNSVTSLAVRYPTIIDFDSATTYNGVHPTNYSVAPSMVNPSNYDFRLASSDTAARGMGTNLSDYHDPDPCGTSASVCPNPPGLANDFAGNPRPSSGAWDIGPYEYTGTGDTTPPPVPTGLTSSSVTSSSVHLSWNASQASDLSGYKVYRNGSEIVTTQSTSYTDVNLTGSTQYSYTVRAFDNSGNVSSPSNTITATTLSSSPLDTDSALKLHLTFQSGFSGDPISPNAFPDVSGNGNSGIRYYYGDTTVPTAGWPISEGGPGDLSAASFRIYPSDTSIIGDSEPYGTGDYVGIKNSPGINNLNQATISVWGKYLSDSTSKSTLLDAGGHVIGSWRLGRQNGTQTQFGVTNGADNPIRVLLFPDGSANPLTDPYNSGNWHLYTITFDGTTFKGYMDGVLIGTDSTTATTNSISKLIIAGSGNLGNYIALGTWAHEGTATWDSGQTGGDQYPNCCWLSGGEADLRIYNRVLSSSEIQSLYAMGSSGTNPPTSTPDQTPPTVSLTSPVSGTTVTPSSITISANASDPTVSGQTTSGIAGVQFKVNGTNLGNEVTTAPYSITWNASSLADGSYTLTAVARDGAGYTTTSSAVTITLHTVVATDSDHDLIPDATDLCPNTPTGVAVNTQGCPLPRATKFTTTNLSGQDLNSVQDFTIENTLGKITFDHATTPYSLITFAGAPLDLDTNVNITRTGISLDSNVMSQFDKHPATLTFKNVNLSNASLAVIKADNGPCSGCTFISYNKPVLTIKVPHFTSFSVIEDTTSPTLPTITSIATSSVTSSSATISWTTDISSDSVVDYGTTISYVSEASSTTSVTSHSINLTNLTPSTLYHFTVLSTDTSGNTGTTGDYIFTTLASPVTDLCPNIDGVQSTIPSGMIMSGGNCVTQSSGGGSTGGSSGSSGGSSGSSGGSSIQTAVVSPGGTSTAYVNPALLQVTQATSTCTTITSPSYTFTRDLTLGSTGNDVKALQQFLNTHGYTVSTTGAGSKGYESTYFGNLTKLALAKYQSANRITPSVGYFGPLTRKTVQSLMIGGTTEVCGVTSPTSLSQSSSYVGQVTPPSVICPPGLICTPKATTVNCPPNMICTPNTTTSPTSLVPSFVGQASTLPALSSQLQSSIPSSFSFAHQIHVNTTDSDVIYLQMFLNSHGYTVATTGPGSPGNESTFFGPATISALSRFQSANGITPAYGNFGMTTAGVVNQMMVQ